MAGTLTLRPMAAGHPIEVDVVDGLLTVTVGEGAAARAVIVECTEDRIALAAAILGDDPTGAGDAAVVAAAREWHAAHAAHAAFLDADAMQPDEDYAAGIARWQRANAGLHAAVGAMGRSADGEQEDTDGR